MKNSCKQCGNTFTFGAEEKTLQEKICETFEVGSFPLSKFCSDCRLQQKMVWRNERFLYRRTCDSSGNKILSVYPEKTEFPVYERSEWWSDKWDALEYGQDFDFNKPFFEQYGQLLRKVPRQALNIQNSENCDYCNFAFESRNCYLCQCSYRSESNLYSYWMLDCKNCIDCSYCFATQRCLDCTDCNHSYNCLSCTLSHTCTDCSFLYDCRGCTNCFGCVGLRRQSYCIFNEQFEKDEYARKLKELDLQNPKVVELVQRRLTELRLKHPHLYSVQEKTESCTGDYIFESKNCHDCYQIFRSQDCLHMQDSDGAKDALHCYHPGWSELIYESYSPVSQHSSAFSIQCWTGNDIYYCDNCQSSSHCFGCVSLRHKKYCILNKEYSQEEYLRMLGKIRTHMEKTGEWGDFFPMSLSPFAYNETLAQQDFPLTEAEARKRGLHWSPPLGHTTGKETLTAGQIPQKINDVPNTITNEILACTVCKKNYKIIPQELEFYRQRQFPIPQTCTECRLEKRMKQRNPRKLWQRTCDKCGKEMKTTYSPDRPEKVYCEECYLKEVY